MNSSFLVTLPNKQEIYIATIVVIVIHGSIVEINRFSEN